MRIRIIANKSIDENCSDISNFIGKEFDAVGYYNLIDSHKYDNSVYVEDLNMIIFEHEYEIL